MDTKTHEGGRTLRGTKRHEGTLRAYAAPVAPHKPLARFGLLGKESRTKLKNSMKLYKNTIFRLKLQFFLENLSIWCPKGAT